MRESRREAGAVACEAEQILLAFVDVSDRAFVLDKDGRFLDVPEAAGAWMRAGMDHAKERSLRDILPPEVAEQVLSTIRTAIDTKQRQVLEYPLDLDGERHWFEGRCSQIPRQPQEEPRVLWVARDISAHKRDVVALQESESRLRAAIECLPYDFWLIGNDGCYAMINATARRNWGDVVGKRPRDVCPDPDTLRVWEENNRRAFAGEVVHTEYEFVVNGRRVCCIGLLAPIGVMGQVLGIVGVNVDITERKRLAQELERVTKSEAVGLLAAGIAHDFNNALTVILGNVSLARRYSSRSPDQADRALEGAEKATIQARSLTQQLLALGKGGEPVFRPTYIPDLVRECAAFATEGTLCHYECQFDPGLRSALVDPIQIHQVLTNLFVNAVHAMPQGGVIQISASNVSSGASLPAQLSAAAYVTILVQDSGAGILQTDMGRIFDPYFTTKASGHGLGLAIAQAIINKHKGLIRVTSEIGRGTTFEVLLPAAADSPEPRR